MSKRKNRHEMVRWETEARAWALDAARGLVYNICTGRPMNACPYNLGVVLEVGEQPWIETPARFLNEPPFGFREPPVRPWLITNRRILSRLGDDQLHGWHWSHLTGCRVDLTAGSERITLDTYFGTSLTWLGPGIIPGAISAIHQLYGPRALAEHPALEALRQR